METIINQMINLITAMSTLRAVFMVFFSLLERRMRRKNKEELQCLSKKEYPSVSIIIAAFNEEKTIEKALNSILTSDYPSFEVLVVNDGSTDNTSKIVKEYQTKSINLKLIDNSSNLGKASSLNIGITQSQFDIILTLDADTILFPSTLKKIVLPLMYHDEVAAVSANIKISNKHNLITKFQSLEYIQSIHTSNRTRSFWKCILILPGAASAYKKEALISVGGFLSRTLAEDADLTHCLLKKGYKTVFENDAFALTEAPFSLRDLFRQRMRWQVGNIQCSLKHMDFIFSKKTRFSHRLLFLDHFIASFTYFMLIPLLLVSIFRSDLSSIGDLFRYLYLLLFIESTLTTFAYYIGNENKYELLYFIPQKIFFLFFNMYLAVCILVKFLTRKNILWHPIQRAG